MKQYIVTEKAPEWVAGRRVKPGDILTLTDQQAEYEVMRGLIEPAPPSRAAAVAAATEKQKPRRRK